nr:unnamed protein product [Callosobruchus analis]
MKNPRKRHKSGSSEEEVDGNESRPEKKRNEMNFFKYSCPWKRKWDATILTKEEEDELIVWILNKAKLGFPLSGDIKDSIENVLKQCPRPNHFKGDRSGKKWLALLLNRHPEVVKRNAETISKTRATITKKSITEWFAELRECLIPSANAGYMFDDPKSIMNCDKAGCLPCPRVKICILLCTILFQTINHLVPSSTEFVRKNQ